MLRLSALFLLQSAAAFAPSTGWVRTPVALEAVVAYENLSDIGYVAGVSKPLGVVFGENGDPFGGLRVDDVESGLNGGQAGLRVGDQLLAVNGVSVVGGDFDGIMDLLRSGADPLELQLFRGDIRQLYTILDNQNLIEEEEPEEEVIMDENYESPVQINVAEVEDEEPLSVGDVFNAFKKIGGKMIEENKQKAAAAPKDEKKGLFGGMFAKEAIQLEGDDASGLK